MKLFIERHAKGITPKKENWKLLPNSTILYNFQPCSIARSHYQEVCITAKLQLPFMFGQEIVGDEITGHFSARHDKKFKWKIKAYFRHLWQKQNK